MTGKNQDLPVSTSMPHNLDDIITIAEYLTLQTGDEVKPNVADIFSCFSNYCRIYDKNYLWDDQFISAFESAQDFLIEISKIKESDCLRT